MTRLCAWCGRQLDEVPREGPRPVTHGLCQACRQEFFPSPGTRERGPQIGQAVEGEGEPASRRPRGGKVRGE